MADLSDREKLLSKIQKLFALAESDNENEANNAVVMAQSLLLQHNLTTDDLNSFTSPKSEKVVQIKTAGKNAERRSAWYVSLASVVANANLCKILFSGPDIIWIGKPSNIEITRFIFDNLVRELSRICEFRWWEFNYGQYNKSKYQRVHGKTWKHNFYMGAIQSVRDRLNANLVQLKAAPSTLALIVHNDYELDEYMDVQHPRVRYVKSTFRQERSGFESGKEAGRTVQFTKGIGSGSGSGGTLGTRKLLGTGK